MRSTVGVRNLHHGDGGNRDPGEVKVKTHPLLGRLRAEIRPLFASTPHRLKARPRPKPVRSALRCSNERNNSLKFPSGRPPHSSWTSISTRSALAPTRRAAVPSSRFRNSVACTTATNAARRRTGPVRAPLNARYRDPSDSSIWPSPEHIYRVTRSPHRAPQRPMAIYRSGNGTASPRIKFSATTRTRPTSSDPNCSHLLFDDTRT